MKQAQLNLAAALLLFFVSILMVFNTTTLPKTNSSNTPPLSTSTLHPTIIPTTPIKLSPVSDTKPSTTPLPQAGLKTYSNLGVSFQYPSVFNIAKPLSPIVATGFISQRFESKDPNTSFIFASTQNTKKTDGSYLSLKEYYSSLPSVSYSTFGSHQVAIYHSQNSTSSQQNSWLSFLSSDRQYIISLGIYFNSSKTSGNEIFNQIIQSLKFND